MDYNVSVKKINTPALSYNGNKNKPQSTNTQSNGSNNFKLNSTTWSNFMQHSIENSIKLNLSVEKLNDILTNEVREIKLNPVQEYNNLADGDKIALLHLIKAAKILNEVFVKQEHKKGTEIKNKLEKKAALGDERAIKTLELYKIFNGIQDERKETNYLIKDEKLADGRNFYQDNITPQEVINYLKQNINEAPEILSNNTVVKKINGKIQAVPYQTEYKTEYEAAAKELQEAAKTSTSKEFNEYLNLQSQALLSSDPEIACKADTAWINLCDTPLEFTIARECYEDKFTGQVLEDKELCELLSKNNISANSKDMIGVRVGIVDREASLDLMDYKNHLKPFSKFLPLADTYKQSVDVDTSEIKQTLVDVDLVYMSGDSATSRPGFVLAQNLPNSDKLAVKRGEGHRNVFHKTIRKSFDPVIREKFLTQLIDDSQRNLYSDDADHLFTIAHELTHSLGPMKTRNGLDKKTALGDFGDAVEEAKADLGGIMMSDYFVKAGKYTQQQMDEIMFTWVAGLLSNEEPSKASAHAVRRVAQFNYLRGCGAITFEEGGKLKVNKDKFLPAVNSMLTEIIKLQLDGDAKAATEFFNTWFVWTKEQAYAAKILQSFKPKIYKKITPELADYILNK